MTAGLSPLRRVIAAEGSRALANRENAIEQLYELGDGGGLQWARTVDLEVLRRETDSAMLRRLGHQLATAGEGLPALTGRGVLPPGIHTTTIPELTERFGTTTHRAALLHKVARVARGAMDECARGAIIGGSFVSSKHAPGDVDLLIVGTRDVPAWEATRRSPLFIPQRAEIAGVDLLAEPRVDAYPAEYAILTPGRANKSADFAPPEFGEGFFEFLQHDRWGVQQGVAFVPRVA